MEFQKHFLSPGTVIALGGGSLLHPQIRALIEKVGTLVYLKATPEILTQRVKKANDQPNLLRPLLATSGNQDLEGKIRSLFEERESFY